MSRIWNKKPKIQRHIIYMALATAILIISSNFFLIETNSKDNIIFKSNEENAKNIKEQKIKENLANMKGFFTKNQGQLENDEIYFTYSAFDNSFAFCESSVLIKLSKTLEDNTTKTSIIKLTFDYSNKAIPEGKKELNHKSNYFIGNDSTKWKINIPNYKKIIYENLYDGIDLIYYFNEKELKYDWIVKPYANPNEIIERYSGINSIKVSKEKLIIKTDIGELVEEKPYSYQNISGNNIDVDVNFKLSGNTLTYNIGEYEPSEHLIIDPLIYSTYIGGSESEWGRAIELDKENNAYVTGWTDSHDFSNTKSAYDQSFNGKSDVFVFKVNSDGSSLIYSTYIGGDEFDYGEDIIIDSNNNAYITGYTSSTNFPTTKGAYDNSYNGKDNYDVDIFVVKLNSDGSNLVYSTFIGGSEGERGFGIALDGKNNAYITGGTSSSDFPTTHDCFNNSHSGGRDVFVIKINSDGSNLLYSTFVGANGGESGHSIVLDSENNAYIAGVTESINFPTSSNCFDDTFNGVEDVFVFKINSNGSDLLFSTFIGGNEDDSGLGIVSIEIDSDNNTYVTSSTSSTNFPTTPGCYDDSYNGHEEGFVFKLNSEGSNLLYSTYIGGKNYDYSLDIALDSENNAYVTGSTSSSDFPSTKYCFDNSFDNSVKNAYGVFVLKLNSEGSNLLYSTHIGGLFSNEEAYSIALDAKNNVYLIGCADYLDFPTTPGCFDDSYYKEEWRPFDVFVLKLNLSRKPILNFKNPTNGAIIDKTTNNSFIVKGNASISNGKITKVQIKIDFGEWENVDGTTNWTYKWKLKNVEKGNHSISVRSLEENSILKINTIKVKVIGDEETNVFLIIFYFLLFIGLIIIGIISYLIYKKKSKKSKSPPVFSPIQKQYPPKQKPPSSPPTPPPSHQQKFNNETNNPRKKRKENN